MNLPDPGKCMHLHMLVFYVAGRERSLEEMIHLITAAEFRVDQIIPTESAVTIIEALR